MKKHLLKTLLVATGLLAGTMSSWADSTITATLVHTAGTRFGSAASSNNTVDSEAEYYNNDTSVGWVGYAFAEFSFTIPEGENISSATLTWTATTTSKARDNKVYFLSPETKLDYTKITSAQERYNYGTARTYITNENFKGTATKTTDVTNCLKTVVDKKQNFIIFQWTGNAGSATLAGKASDKAPILVIQTTKQALYTVSFNETNNVNPSITVYSDETRTKTVQPNNLTANTKYYFSASLAGYEDYKGEFTVGEENPTVSFTMTKKERFTYSICLQDEKENTLKTIIEDKDAYSGKVINYSYPKYLTNEEGKVTYICNETTFVNSITPSASGFTAIYYTPYKGTAYFIEGENSITGTNVEDNRYSEGKAVRGFTDNNLFTIKEDGTYKLTYVVCSNNVNNSRTVSICINNEENSSTDVTWSVNKINTDGILTINNIAVKANDVIKIKASDTNIILDYILLEKVSETANIGDAQYATYVTSSAVVVPENVKVYTVKANATGIETTEVAAGTVIPANTAVLLNAEEAGDYAFTVSAEEGTTLENNDLKAGTGAAATGVEYCLTQQDGKVGFAKVKEGVEIPAGKAYLVVNGQAASNFFALGGNETAIKNIETEKTTDNAYYTLQGVKVVNPAKGVYIHNGKKVVIK